MALFVSICFRATCSIEGKYKHGANLCLRQNMHAYMHTWRHALLIRLSIHKAAARDKVWPGLACLLYCVCLSTIIVGSWCGVLVVQVVAACPLLVWAS